jgi:glycosyltransferase involved in cell wall biosynthesis
MGYDVLLVGRKLTDSLPLQKRNYQTKRLRLLFTKGALFYAELNFRLFLFLLFRKTDVLLANDLDTLLPNYLVSKIKKKDLVYDTHEYFTEVPELIEGSFAKNTWLRIEKWIFPKLKNVITVNESIANIYKEKYKNDVKIVRNIPLKKVENNEKKSRKELDLPLHKNIILMQGAGINIDRGAEEMVKAMQYLSDDYLFLIIGGGDVFDILKQDIEILKLQEKVWILGKKDYQTLQHYTACADLGISLDKDTNLNYRYSLPNKLFDYINGNTPVLISNLVEIKRIVETYKVGWVINSHEPQAIADKIKIIFNDKDDYNLKKENAKTASAKLHWGNEEKVLKDIYLPLIKK